MASYSFTRRDTGERDNLADVDAAICAYVGKDVSETDYCGEYSIFLELGFAWLMKNGGSNIPADAEPPWREGVKFDGKVHTDRLWRWIISNWKFDAWR
jgi:hypothetical protein